MVDSEDYLGKAAAFVGEYANGFSSPVDTASALIELARVKQMVALTASNNRLAVAIEQANRLKVGIPEPGDLSERVDTNVGVADVEPGARIPSMQEIPA